MPRTSSSNTLIIVESPAKAKTIQGYLDDRYTVIATGGHIMDIPSTGLCVDVKNKFSIKKEILPRKFRQVQSIKKAISNAGEIIVATDPDREGEAIAFDVVSLGDKTKNWIRCGFQEITPSGVQEKLKNPDPFRESTLQSQETRRILDRLFGYLISPLLWKKIQGGTSAGRVQSVLLRWICEREEEILNFQPEKYLELYAWEELISCRSDWESANENGFKWVRGKNVLQPGEKFWNAMEDNTHKSAFSLETSKGVREFLNWKNEFRVSKREDKDIQIYPPPPFKTSTLQEEASQNFGWSPKKTMSVAQTLYEGVSGEGGKRVGLITYPRTDSTRLSASAILKAEAVIEKKWGKKYLSKGKLPSRVKKSNSKIQDAHEAIRPTLVESDLDRTIGFLKPDEKKLYEMIFKRFFASLTAPKEGIKTVVELDGLGEKWRKESFRETFDGFGVWYSRNTKKNIELPYQKNDSVSIQTISLEWKSTDPPQRFTQSALVKKMESLGIGRPSTYAPSIEVLSERKYIYWEKKFCHPTALGKEVNSFLVSAFQDLIADDFSSKMEESLDRVEEGVISKLDVLTPFYESLVGKMKVSHAADMSSRSPQQDSRGKLDRFKSNPCPLCGEGELKRKASKKGGVIEYCSRFPECEYGNYL